MLEKLLSYLGNIYEQKETTADATDCYHPRKKRQTVSKRACGQPKNFASTDPSGDVVVSLSGPRGWRLRRKEFRRSLLRSSLKVHLPNATIENIVWKAKAYIYLFSRYLLTRSGRYISICSFFSIKINFIMKNSEKRIIEKFLIRMQIKNDQDTNKIMSKG